MTNSDFGQRLKTLRKAKGLSQKALAERLGATRRMICYYECEAERPPQSYILPQLAEALGVTIDKLLNSNAPTLDGRTLDGKFLNKWEQLGEEEKSTIIRVMDSMLNKNPS